MGVMIQLPSCGRKNVINWFSTGSMCPRQALCAHFLQAMGGVLADPTQGGTGQARHLRREFDKVPARLAWQELEAGGMLQERRSSSLGTLRGLAGFQGPAPA